MSGPSQNPSDPDSGLPVPSGSMTGRGGDSWPREVQPRPPWLTVVVCLLLAAGVGAVFGQTLRFAFVNYDDIANVYDNPNIVPGLTWRGIGWAFTHIQVARWAPIATLSRLLDCTLFGLWPGGHHLTNMLLHMAASLLLFLVLKQMSGAFWRSAFVAAVFAFHPLQVESVAWVSARGDVLSALFFMLTLWAYVRYVHQSTVPAAASTFQRFTLHASRYYWLALGFFALGLMSKTMVVTLPLILLLLDYWPLGRFTPTPDVGVGAQRFNASTLQRLLVEKIPFFILSAAGCLTTVLAQSRAGADFPVAPWPWRVGNAFVSYADYIGELFYPARLAVFYPHPGTHLALWKVGLSVLILAIISIGVIVGRRKQPWLLVGWLWYLGMLVPVIGIVNNGDHARADRYTYLPQIGLGILVAWGAAELLGRAALPRRRLLLGSAAGVTLAALMAVAYIQTGYWKDSVTLWRHTLACTSGNRLAHDNLGAALGSQGKWAEARQQFDQALQLDPNDAGTHNDLGLVLDAQGKRGEAIEQYERALELKPAYAGARVNLGDALAAQGNLTEAIQQFEQALQLEPDSAEAHYNLGIALARQGKSDQAIQEFQQALRLRPNLSDAQKYLAKLLASQGRSPEAVQLYQRALQLDPNSAKTHFSLGQALAQEGKWDEAIQEYGKALQLTPDQPAIHVSWGVALAAQRNFNEAIQHYQQALQLDPDSVEAHSDLGAALAAQGNWAQAVQQCERAVQLAPDQALPQMNLGNVLAMQGKMAEAIPHFERAVQLKPDYAKAHFNLAAALDHEGKSAEALPHFQQALDLATAQGDIALANAARARLQPNPAPPPQSPTP
ncbi:MAG: tetratricopeptide repeat protein [Verrucomicrobiota bacterium]